MMLRGLLAQDCLVAFLTVLIASTVSAMSLFSFFVFWFVFLCAFGDVFSYYAGFDIYVAYVVNYCVMFGGG